MTDADRGGGLRGDRHAGDLPSPDPAPAGLSVDVGLVAIGRNEGERLRRCLESAAAAGLRAVYVDSGSSDGSAAMAEAMGARVVHLDPAVGFTAARARNAGAAALPEAGAGAGGDLQTRAGGDPLAPAFIQFVDGDCELVPGWIEAARAALIADPGLAAVAGRRRERFPDASIFNRLCDMEWNTPAGEARAVGGDALYRAEAFRAVGGFDPAFICGEEPELCFRLRREGWRIARLDRDMTLHDADMHRWGQWARRAERSGWAYAEGAATYGATAERYNRAPLRSLKMWGAAFPAMLAALVLAALILALLGAGAGAGAAAGLAAGALGLWAAMVLRIARFRRARFGDPWRRALLYALLVQLGKPFQFKGARAYAAAVARGERGRIIEYKSAGPTKETRG